MRILPLVVLAFLVSASSLFSQTATRREFTIFHPGNGVANLLDPATMVVDTWRGEIFVASASQKRITAINPVGPDAIQSRTEEDNLPWVVDLLAVDEANRRLLCTPRGSFPRVAALHAYDFEAAAIAKSVSMGPCDRLSIIPDTRRGVLYASTGRQHILILNLASLAIQDSIDFELPCGDLAFDSAHAELYAAQALPVQGISRIKKFNVANHELLRSIQFPAPVPYDRIQCDPQSGNVMVFSKGAVHSFDAFGFSLFQYGINDDVSMTAASGQYHRAYVTNVRGDYMNGSAGTRGRMHIVGFQSTEIDSLDFPFPVSAVTVFERDRSLAVLSRAEQTVYILDLADYRPLGDQLLGKRLEGAAVLSGLPLQQARISVVNPSFADAGFISHQIAANRDDAYPAGYHAVDVEALNGSGGFAALNQADGTLTLHDASGVAYAEIPTGGYAGLSDRLPSIVASRDGLDHVLAVFPEYLSYALFDTRNRTMLTAGFVDGLINMSGSGKGLLQACFVPGGEYYCILRLDDKVLNVYRRSDYAFIRAINLHSINWNYFAGYERIALQPGPDDGTIYVGPYLVHASNIAPPQLGNSFFPVTLAHYPHFTKAVFENGNLSIVRGMNVTQQVNLRQNTPISDVYAAHDGSMFLFSFTDDAKVVFITVELPVAVEDVPAPGSSALQLYPNPVPLGGTLSLRLPSAYAESEIACTLTDLAGRSYAEFNAVLKEGEARIPLGGMYIPAGMYVFRAVSGKNTHSRIVVIAP